MLLGPAGWVLSVALVIAAAIIVVTALRLIRARSALLRAAGAGLAVVGVAVALQAIPPEVGEGISLKAIHDASYPLIPLGWLTAAILAGVARWPSPAGRPLVRATAVFVPLFVAAVWGTTVDVIAQASRYVLFVLQLGWFQLLAAALDTMQPVDSGGKT